MPENSFEKVLDEHGFLLYDNVGCSMRPLIKEGRDYMIIESVKRRSPKLYDAVLFHRNGVKGRGEYVLHRILRDNADGTYWIVGDNCFAGETVRAEDILGVLVGLKRKLGTQSRREISFDSKLYKLYLALWCKPYRLRFALIRTRSLVFRAGGKVKRTIKSLAK